MTLEDKTNPTHYLDIRGNKIVTYEGTLDSAINVVRLLRVATESKQFPRPRYDSITSRLYKIFGEELGLDKKQVKRINLNKFHLRELKQHGK